MIKHKFVTNIPNVLEDNIIYISIKYNTASHNCFCGCGEEVVTPISPTDWKIIYNGYTISLDPSIGNWSFNCKSHYWIKNSNIIWSRRWSKKEILEGRRKDLLKKEKYYQIQEKQLNIEKEKKPVRFFAKIKSLLSKIIKYR